MNLKNLNVHGGHNFNVSGANGCFSFSETTEDRKVKDGVISKLRSLGFTVHDCTDDAGTTQNENLKNIVSKCNAHTVDLDISIHFNAYNGQANGVEVLQYSNKTQEVAQNICNAIAELGFKNRGVKQRTDLYVLKHTKAPAILIECCFCDSEIDAGLYNADAMASAIVKGLTGEAKETVQPQPTPTPTPTPAPTPSGDDWVRRLQEELNAQFNKGLVVDGLKGPKTLNACPQVKKGAKGNVTRLIQERLNSVGFNISTDGIFGENTKNAVKVFQKNRGLTQDGIVGPNTWEWFLKGTKM